MNQVSSAGDALKSQIAFPYQFRFHHGYYTCMTILTMTILTRAHSHNDYWRPRPLLDALENGFCSVEADIFLVEGKLLVGHDPKELKPERTLQSLYLDPLRERVRRNRGRVYEDGPLEFNLLIDIKAEGEKAYGHLRQVLQRDYRQILTVFDEREKKPGAVTIVISGDRPRRMMEAEKRDRLAGLDGRIEDLDKGIPPTFMPLVSQSWMSLFKWMGSGEMPADERARLQEWVKKAHGQGYKMRFWGALDVPAIWQAQYEAGVDYINTDRVAMLREFLLKRG